VKGRRSHRRRGVAIAAALAAHAVVLWSAVVADRARRGERAEDRALAVRILALPVPPSAPAPPARTPRTPRQPGPTPVSPAAPDAAPAVAAPAPIDWDAAAASAARAAVDAQVATGTYRDLAGAPPAVRAWLEAEHLTPARPGLPWRHARVEFTPEGFPIIRINDHCVSLPMLAFLVFCKLGRIEADGHLFDHLRDAGDP
jgi:hypothetical protein